MSCDHHHLFSMSRVQLCHDDVILDHMMFLDCRGVSCKLVMNVNFTLSKVGC